MTGILDTHVFIWAAEDPSKLFAPAVAFIQDPANTILVSVVNVWEIIIKSQTRKLGLRQPIRQVLPHIVPGQFSLLQVALPHVLAVESLPPVHRDPFDRLLAAQAIAEGAALVSADPVFARYPVTIVW